MAPGPFEAARLTSNNEIGVTVSNLSEGGCFVQTPSEVGPARECPFPYVSPTSGSYLSQARSFTVSLASES